jgi:hypothetical protein
MALTIHSVEHDSVIKSFFISAQADYQFALDELVPLIGRLEIQREVQNQKFYDRLAKDILNGCIMPPLTLAIVDTTLEAMTNAQAKRYVLDHVSDFFILDGMQRLNTIDRIAKREPARFPTTRPLFLNILVCKSMDLLLYRMITLNNGQKPMTARHQIEIVASNIYDFDDATIQIQTEKLPAGQRRRRGSFKKVDLIKGYLAFLSESVNVDNDKIIQEKMDDLLASKIMNSDITTSSDSFDDVLDQIERLYSLESCRSWIMVQNNLIGFCAGSRRSIRDLKRISDGVLSQAIENFEEAFSGINVSKIKLGNSRRKAVQLFMTHLKKMVNMSADEMLDDISQEI